MSINKLISIKNAIDDATDMAAIDHNNFLPLFMTWAAYAEKEIGGASAITKYAVLDICGCAAELPCDAISVEGAILGCHETNCGQLFSNVFSTQFTTSHVVGNNFVIVDVGGSQDYLSCGIVPYTYQDNKLIFGNGCITATQITIKYLGTVNDCDGYPLVSENHIEAITEFISYKWLRRKRKKSQADVREMELARMEWDRLCIHARALDNQLTDTDKEEIAQMLHDAYSGRGLWQGMKTIQYGTIGY